MKFEATYRELQFLIVGAAAGVGFALFVGDEAWRVLPIIGIPFVLLFIARVTSNN